ncbi:SusC/RagA family TonB-linked outer membrane protein [Arthrospiribacter ruber]|uniref:SusC/RagA family TonB-linked outer membrane protein n=1 Tax=Arthrospiribacter ruber TaxID=2487934 RepID=A0A951IVL5_9BACT|nr:SusC/RagA family TonB-linked outer membrane protein [Arthrospiribacter ruber]MBW3466862.1 SusC/RagA family TonB-linked outer membrane protein [Arthrospiribacter ruber]
MKQIYLITSILCLWLSGLVAAQSDVTIKGNVRDADDGMPIPGVVIKVQGRTSATVSDKDGNFEIVPGPGDQILEFSYIGYTKFEYPLKDQDISTIVVRMEKEDFALEGVEIYSTGYQNLSKERSTGSFVALDNELINRRVSTGILDRLEDVTSGLIFNRIGGQADPISIRGRSTIFANTSPLIVIDNFPYDGPLENINPNDIENITILRDAAAASIWGARAGNGVIVINTKSGRKGEGLRVSLNVNSNIIEAQDQFYRPLMGSSDFLEVEKVLFERGVFNSAEISLNRTALSHGVETLIAHRDGRITEAEKNAILQGFRQNDVRNDLSKHFFRNQVNKQYALDISGANESVNYMFSAGYDDNTEDIVGNRNSRLTLNSKNTFNFLNGKLRLNTGIYYVQTQRNQSTEVPTSLDYSIYDTFSDVNGMHLPISRTYSTRYLESVESNHPSLVDWRYRPLDEIGLLDRSNTFRDLRINAGLDYKISEGLYLELLHQYWQGVGATENYSPFESFFVRDLVNRFTQLSPDGITSNAVPQGSILDWGISESKSQNFRSQLRYGKTIGNHELNLLGGFEAKDLSVDSRSGRYYGYRRDLGTNMFVDFANQYSQFHNPNSIQRIPAGEAISGTVERYISYYGNAAYTYKKLYGLTLSARKDASNLFGVETNLRGVPLWSVGGSWILSEERFFTSKWVDFLKIRTTYGYNGNVDRTLSSLTTATFFGGSFNRITGLPSARINNPPNPNLRWEKIGMLNLGIDFSFKDEKLSGNIEFYRKTGEDLIGSIPMPSSRGINSFRGNFADTRTVGADVVLSYALVMKRDFSWRTNLLASHVYEKVTGYELEASPLQYLTAGDGFGVPTPLEGKPLIAIYSFPSAGLDPDSGMPRGYLDGEPSMDYARIFSTASMDELIYHGPARPVHFGALRNDFRINNFSVSINVSYRLGHYFRRESVNYNELLNGRISHNDYALRWQQPGDERHTNIPAFPSAMNFNRDRFFQFSEDLVERGDNIRLQDIRLAYRFDKTRGSRTNVKGIEVYTYLNNVAMLWKATDQPIDPDFPIMRPLRSFAFGLRMDL